MDTTVDYRESEHFPVMHQEMLEAVSPKDNEVYIDATFGAGGYSKLLLEAAKCQVLALDRDANVIEKSKHFKEAYGERFVFVEGRFGDMEQHLDRLGVSQVDAIILDIGVSSMQLDQGERGFSFMHQGPLDMRMGQEGLTAQDIVNGYTEEQIANILYTYGGEKKSRRIAKAIIEAREEEPITTTLQLANIIRAVLPKGREKIDPATRSFQALRICVNDELGELEKALHAAEKLLKDGGRLVVVTFHSLEDAIVKAFIQDRLGKVIQTSRHLPPVEETKEQRFAWVYKKALTPGEDEIHANIRSRSAKLRAAKRVRRAS